MRNLFFLSILSLFLSCTDTDVSEDLTNSSSSVIAVGTNGSIYYTTDDGSSWNSSSSGTSNEIVGVACEGSTAIAVTDTEVLYSSNSGVSWSLAVLAFSDIQAVAIGNGTAVLIDLGDNNAYYSTDGGVSWLVSTNSSGSAFNANGPAEHDIAFGNDRFIITDDLDFLWESTGGQDFSLNDFNGAGGYDGIASANDLFFNNEFVFNTLPVSVALSGFPADANAVVFDGSTYFAIEPSTGSLFSSTDTTNWSNAGTISASVVVSDMVLSGSNLIVSADSSTVLVSSDPSSVSFQEIVLDSNLETFNGLAVCN